jgi:hypothetical protein
MSIVSSPDARRLPQTVLAYLIWAIRFGWPLVEPCTLLHC